MRLNNNQKGFSMIELLLALAIMALIGTLLTALLLFGTDTFRVYSNFTGQQDRIVDSLQRLRKDIEEASRITVYTQADGTFCTNFIRIDFPDAPQARVWRFEDGKLELGVMPDASTQPASFQEAVGKLDTSAAGCKFKFSSTDGMITVFILPAANNSGRYEGKNIKDPIVTDFSVKYKSTEVRVYDAAY
jgi:prepilin-type N-terminal cleavage/methylation domain-containing protein